MWPLKILHVSTFIMMLIHTGHALPSDLKLISNSASYTCKKLDSNASYFKCTEGQQNKAIYLTNARGRYPRYSGFALTGQGHPIEIPIAKIETNTGKVIRDTPNHHVSENKETLETRIRLLEKVKDGIKHSPIPEELKPFIDYIEKETNSLNQLSNCSSLTVSTDNDSAPEMNCKREERREKNNCDLFYCKTAEGKSILISYPNINTINNLPQIWALEQGKPDKYTRAMKVICQGETLYDHTISKEREQPSFTRKKSNLRSSTPGFDPLSIEQRFDLSNFKNFEDQAKNCHSEKIDSHIRAELKFKKKYSTSLTQERLATVVRIVSSTLSIGVDARSNLGEYCEISPGIFINGDLQSNQEALEMVKSEFQLTEEKTTLEAADLEPLYNEVKGLSNMAYHYTIDGCYARAHLIHNYINKAKSINCKKIWLQGEYLYPINSQDTTWTYHVAVTCPVRQADGKVVQRIFDPTIGSAPMGQEEWFKAMNVESPLPTGRSLIKDKSIFSFSISDENQYIPYEPPGNYRESIRRARETLEKYENF